MLYVWTGFRCKPVLHFSRYSNKWLNSMSVSLFKVQLLQTHPVALIYGDPWQRPPGLRLLSNPPSVCLLLFTDIQAFILSCSTLSCLYISFKKKLKSGKRNSPPQSHLIAFALWHLKRKFRISKLTVPELHKPCGHMIKWDILLLLQPFGGVLAHSA